MIRTYKDASAGISSGVMQSSVVHLPQVALGKCCWLVCPSLSPVLPCVDECMTVCVMVATTTCAHGSRRLQSGCAMQPSLSLVQ